MSFFAVEKTKISKIIPIEGADRVALAQVVGMTYQFVVGKSDFSVGSECVYFPIDSVLPIELVNHFGIGKFLSGKEHNRVKTNKFLKQISQGYVASIESVLNYLNTYCPIPDTGQPFTTENLPNDLTQLLAVKKYEAPEVFVGNAKLTKLDVGVYDIEGVSRYQNVVDYLMDLDVLISEKVEGMNMFLEIKGNGEIRIAQRNYYITSNDPENPHSFEKVATRDLLPVAKRIQDEKYPNCDVRIRAEFLGESSQGNYYMFKGQKALVFEIDVNSVPLNASDVVELVKEYNIPFVPIVFIGKLRDYLNGKTIQEMSNGKSALVDRLREGIVIRPLVEKSLDGFGRCIVKHRSEEYLAKTDF